MINDVPACQFGGNLNCIIQSVADKQNAVTQISVIYEIYWVLSYEVEHSPYYDRQVLDSAFLALVIFLSFQQFLFSANEFINQRTRKQVSFS